LSTRPILLVVPIALALGLAACGGGDGGSSNLAVGETAVVDHTQILSGGKPGPTTTLAITVLKVKQGTQDELKRAGLQLDPDEQRATPYYVETRYENQGDQTIKRDLLVSLEDGDGNTISSTTIINLGGDPFQPCPQAEKGVLAPGQSYESCMLFLVPEGKTAKKVSFLPYNPEKETEFVYWTIE
jgi:hypothetical protein